MCLYDEQQYPHTIVEALSIADLCVSFYSTAVTEAVAFGVPHLNVDFSAEDWYAANSNRHLFGMLYNNEKGGLFEFPGAAVTMNIPDIIHHLPHKRLTDFRVDPRAQAAYVRRYLGFNDGHSSRRTLDAIEATFQTGTRGARPC
jgi:hypothetical protein